MVCKLGMFFLKHIGFFLGLLRDKSFHTVRALLLSKRNLEKGTTNLQDFRQ